MHGNPRGRCLGDIQIRVRGRGRVTVTLTVRDRVRVRNRVRIRVRVGVRVRVRARVRVPWRDSVPSLREIRIEKWDSLFWMASKTSSVTSTLG